jgi:hypothetical protein
MWYGTAISKKLAEIHGLTEPGIKLDVVKRIQIERTRTLIREWVS